MAGTTLIKPGKGTDCDKLLTVMRRRRLTTTGACRMGITSFHRRMTDLRQMGYTISQQQMYRYDERGKVRKKWKEYWIDER